MSKIATTRAKSGGSIRPLESVHHSLMSPSEPRQNKIGRSVPALQITQLKTQRSPSQPNSQLRGIDRDYKVLFNSYVQMTQNFKDQKFRAKKMEDREEDFKNAIAGLEKVLIGLKSELNTKTNILEVQKRTMGMKINHLEMQLVEKEVQFADAKNKIKESEEKVDAKQNQIDLIIDGYEDKIKDLKEEHRKEIESIEAEKEAMLRKRDNKLRILKRGVEEAAGNSSSERLQQMEGLKRELANVSHEARNLEKQLMHLHRSPPKCPNCIDLATQLDEKILKLKMKDKSIDDLQNAGKSMQSQLLKQHRASVMKEKRSYEKQRAMCIKAGLKPPTRKAENTPTSQILANKRARVKSASDCLNARKDALMADWENSEF